MRGEAVERLIRKQLRGGALLALQKFSFLPNQLLRPLRVYISLSLDLIFEKKKKKGDVITQEAVTRKKRSILCV